MTERVLRQAALLAPRFNLQAEALPSIQQGLYLLTDGREVTAMEFDPVYWQSYTASLTETEECRKSQVHFCICDKVRSSDCGRI